MVSHLGRLLGRATLTVFLPTALTLPGQLWLSGPIVPEEVGKQCGGNSCVVARIKNLSSAHTTHLSQHHFIPITHLVTFGHNLRPTDKQ